MSYRFKPKSKAADEVIRILEERSQHAIQCLADYPSPNPEGLHSARKDIKKMRSLIRLLRGKAARKLRRALNLELRGIGLDLSVRRDQEVIVAMLTEWQTRDAVRRKTSLRNAVDRMLHGIKQRSPGAAPIEPTIEASVIRRLAHVCERLQSADLHLLSWESLSCAARKRRTRLNRARLAYLADPNFESLHEWRKQLKNRLHHLRLLRKQAARTKLELKRIRKLESLLGETRDHDLLIDTLLNSMNTGLSIHELGALLTYAEMEKEKRLRKALRQST